MNERTSSLSGVAGRAATQLRTHVRRTHFRARGALAALAIALALTHGAAAASPRLPLVPQDQRTAEQRAIAAQLDALGVANAVGT